MSATLVFFIIISMYLLFSLGNSVKVIALVDDFNMKSRMALNLFVSFVMKVMFLVCFTVGCIIIHASLII